MLKDNKLTCCLCESVYTSQRARRAIQSSLDA